MRIAVNTRLLLHGRLDGWGRFANETLRLMVQQHPGHEFIFLFDRRPHPEFILGPNVTPVTVHPQARHPWLWHIWFEWMLPSALRRHKADLFLSPDGYLSLSTGVPSVPVIHDLNFMHSPGDIPAHHARYLNRNFPRFAKKAARIATVSEFSRQDIAAHYAIDPEHIDVVYNGVSERFRPATDAERVSAKDRWTDGSPYFIYVGAMHPRKNIVRMLQAFDAFKQTDASGTKLVMVGSRQWWTDEMETALNAMLHRDKVVQPGRVSDADLGPLLGGALASVYVSTFEGFGIPIIEAFQADVPVITSNLTAMPEVAGDAALLVDPFSVESITEAMRSISTDQGLRTSLVTKGRSQARQFTWQRTSSLLWDCMMRAVGQSA